MLGPTGSCRSGRAIVIREFEFQCCWTDGFVPVTVVRIVIREFEFQCCWTDGFVPVTVAP